MVDSFWGVFWVDVSSESTAAASFLRISDVLGSPVQNIDDARHLLSNVKHNWLLVLDNADDPDTDYERYFPSGTRGAILMTSRVPECSSYNMVGFEQLESLSSDECLTLLLRATKIPAEAWAELWRIDAARTREYSSGNRKCAGNFLRKSAQANIRH